MNEIVSDWFAPTVTATRKGVSCTEAFRDIFYNRKVVCRVLGPLEIYFTIVKLCRIH